MRFIDLTGKVFGNLTALNVSETRLRDVMSWDCICACGNKKVVAAADLRRLDTKSCGCLKGKPRKDITGVKRGSLTAVSCTENKTNNGDYKWNFLCDCGNTHILSIGTFMFNPHPCCKTCGKKRAIAAHTTHGFKGSHKTYKAWCKIKERCFNPKSKDYPLYGAKGITVEKYFLDDFMNFYREIGEAPKDGKRWSIDRIDHTKNYERGNIRWATDTQQARNKGKMKNNTSGYTGVKWDDKLHPNKKSSTLYAIAIWCCHDGFNTKQKTKAFSVKKYGLLEAYYMACLHRQQMILDLDKQGYGYSVNHGE